MQRPIPATEVFPYKSQALSAFPEVRERLKAQGLTRPPGRMCAAVGKHGTGWVVFIGFQDSD